MTIKGKRRELVKSILSLSHIIIINLKNTFLYFNIGMIYMIDSGCKHQLRERREGEWTASPLMSWRSWKR